MKPDIMFIRTHLYLALANRLRPPTVSERKQTPGPADSSLTICFALSSLSTTLRLSKWTSHTDFYMNILTDAIIALSDHSFAWLT
jgi:hypothetical protein